MILNKTLGEQVLEKLKDDILSGTYKPGDRLLYTEIASKMGVSMTPVKEALLRLEQEGIVETIARRGTYVREITDQDIIEYTQIRIALESLAADIICEKRIPPEEIRELSRINKKLKRAITRGQTTESLARDIEFHSTIIKLSGSKRLLDLMGLLPLTNFHALRSAQGLMLKLGAVVIGTHENIAAALCEHNARLAKKFLKENIMPQLSMVAPTPPN
jgi:DNA-binding GntR family transcriptional regulator